MYTFCDRTGKIFNIKADLKDTTDGWLPGSTECTAELIGDSSDEVVIRGGDGSAGKKPLKVEWCAAASLAFAIPAHWRLLVFHTQ